MRKRWRQVLDSAAVVAAAVAASLAFAALGVPSPALFGGLVAGLVRALAVHRPGGRPRPATTAAQAVIGVSIGALVDLATLRPMAANWLPVLTGHRWRPWRSASAPASCSGCSAGSAR